MADALISINNTILSANSRADMADITVLKAEKGRCRLFVLVTKAVCRNTG